MKTRARILTTFREIRAGDRIISGRTGRVLCTVKSACHQLFAKTTTLVADWVRVLEGRNETTHASTTRVNVSRHLV